MKVTRLMIAVMLTAMMGFAQEKIVVVNMIDLIRYHPNRERDRKLMTDTEKEYQEKLDKRRERFEQLRDEFERVAKEARNPALSDKARSEAETKALKQRDVVSEAERDLRQEAQKLQRELADLDTRLLRQVTGEIRETITKYAKDTKSTLVMDASTLAYSDPKMDVTDDVLKRMGIDPKVRKEAKEEAEKKAAAATSKK
ncbi:MAG: OmpH family outer membrane protein [bacterium]